MTVLSSRDFVWGTKEKVYWLCVGTVLVLILIVWTTLTLTTERGAVGINKNKLQSQSDSKGKENAELNSEETAKLDFDSKSPELTIQWLKSIYTPFFFSPTDNDVVRSAAGERFRVQLDSAKGKKLAWVATVVRVQNFYGEKPGIEVHIRDFVSSPDPLADPLYTLAVSAWPKHLQVDPTAPWVASLRNGSQVRVEGTVKQFRYCPYPPKYEFTVDLLDAIVSPIDP